MKIKIEKKDIFLGYLAQFFNLGSGVILLPLILKNLTQEEIGMWYIFLAISSFVYLMDFGFSPTIQRNISYVFSGIQSIEKVGISNIKSQEINYDLLRNLLYTSKKIYSKISIFLCIFLLSFGTKYIIKISTNYINQRQMLFAWILFVISLLINYYYYYYDAFLKGRGFIGESNKILIYSKIMFILVTILGISLNMGLISLSIGNIASVLIIRVLSYKKFYDINLKENLKKIKEKKIKEKNLSNILLYNSLKAGVVALGAFLILKANTFIVSNFFNLTIVAEYGLSLQIFSLLGGISTTFMKIMLPKISEYRANKNLKKLREIYTISLINLIVIEFIGNIFIIIFGPKILGLIKSNTTLLDVKYLIFMSIILFLETIHTNASMFIATSNEIPFVKSAILSGIGIIILSVIFIKILKIGFFGVLLSQGIVQLIYNNWYWPYKVFKDLDFNFFDMLYILKNNFIRNNKY